MRGLTNHIRCCGKIIVPTSWQSPTQEQIACLFTSDFPISVSVYCHKYFSIFLNVRLSNPWPWELGLTRSNILSSKWNPSWIKGRRILSWNLLVLFWKWLSLLKLTTNRLYHWRTLQRIKGPWFNWRQGSRGYWSNGWWNGCISWWWCMHRRILL